MSLHPDHLTGESRIVWLEDPANLPYVRERLHTTLPRRVGRPNWRRQAGRLVGYAELTPTTPRNRYGRFSRRVFWLMPHDRANAPEDVYRTGCPSEGVDPLTVAPGVPGTLTERAWGGPLPGRAVEEPS